MSSAFALNREITATAIPSGESIRLANGTSVFVTQSLGGSVTVRTEAGLFRIDRDDAGAIDGYSAPEAGGAAGGAQEFSEGAVWQALKTCFDPEIPVNIVDLGLVYDLNIEEAPAGGKKVDVKMTLTAPGCGMGPMIAEDARRKIADLPDVREAKVFIVWDPVWNPRMISAEGRQVLGLE
jgi:probable FeS assembly SUF system protein SufT